jgi:hypothetical protein
MRTLFGSWRGLQTPPRRAREKRDGRLTNILSVRQTEHPVSTHVAFSGVDMNMGRIEIPLQAQHHGVFTVETILLACIRRQLTWQAVITLESPVPESRPHNACVLRLSAQ